MYLYLLSLAIVLVESILMFGTIFPSIFWHPVIAVPLWLLLRKRLRKESNQRNAGWIGTILHVAFLFTALSVYRMRPTIFVHVWKFAGAVFACINIIKRPMKFPLRHVLHLGVMLVSIAYAIDYCLFLVSPQDEILFEAYDGRSVEYGTLFAIGCLIQLVPHTIRYINEKISSQTGT